MLQAEVVKYDCRQRINILATNLSVIYIIILKTKLFQNKIIFISVFS